MFVTPNSESPVHSPFATKRRAIIPSRGHVCEKFLWFTANSVKMCEQKPSIICTEFVLTTQQKGDKQTHLGQCVSAPQLLKGTILTERDKEQKEQREKEREGEREKRERDRANWEREWRREREREREGERNGERQREGGRERREKRETEQAERERERARERRERERERNRERNRRRETERERGREREEKRKIRLLSSRCVVQETWRWAAFGQVSVTSSSKGTWTQNQLFSRSAESRAAFVSSSQGCRKPVGGGL